METVLVRLLFIFFVFSFAILMFSIYKNRTNVVEVFKKWGTIIFLVIFWGAVAWFFILTILGSANAGSIPDRWDRW